MDDAIFNSFIRIHFSGWVKYFFSCQPFLIQTQPFWIMIFQGSPALLSPACRVAVHENQSPALFRRMRRGRLKAFTPQIAFDFRGIPQKRPDALCILCPQRERQRMGGLKTILFYGSQMQSSTQNLEGGPGKHTGQQKKLFSKQRRNPLRQTRQRIPGKVLPEL